MGKKFYAVAVGRNVGIYDTWDECEQQIHGYPEAKFKSFKKEEDAKAFVVSTQTGGCRYANSKATAYAVVRGKVPGLYFSEAEAKAQIVGFRNPIFRGFKAIKDAEDYLENSGLVSTQPGGWLSTDRKPILYTPKRSRNGNQKENHDSQHQQPIEILSSSPEAIEIFSSPEEKQQPIPVMKRQRIEGECESSKKFKSNGMEDEQGNDGDEEEEEVAIQDMKLDTIQRAAIDAASSGENLFITGVAGTGKSLVTRLIVENAKAMNKEVAVAAPTGVAAVNLNLGAQTVHSLAGIKVPQRARDFATMHSRYNVKKWRKMEVLVIDEIGMVCGDFLDWLDVNVRRIRKNLLEAFGGIQLIFVGDFAQLGPVPGSISLRSKPHGPNDPGADCVLDIKECTAYAFQSVAWREAKFHHVHLTKVYRQSDQDFILALRNLRENKSTSALVGNLVKQCSSPLESRKGIDIPEGIRPTVLYCTNYQVDKENYDNLVALKTEYKRFGAVDSVDVDGDVASGAASDIVREKLLRDKFFDQCQAPRNLDLKVGAQVMLLHNLSDTLVNGSRGVIESFKLCPVVKNINGKEKIIGPDDQKLFLGRRFDELKWGMMLEFEGYNWKIFKFTKFPLVKFMNNESKIIVPAAFERNLYRQGICKRMQVPLRLAWALTIHKAQGSSLDLVICDLKGCFTAGQAYVALSRARTMIGLQIRNFDPKCVKTESLVEGFYSALDMDQIDKFLEERAGIWWFPVLNAPSWLSMFSNARNKEAKNNAEKFKEWLQEYEPDESYNGWRGFTGV